MTRDQSWIADRRFVVVISGATGAIGSALALAYASPRTTLVLLGRDTVKIESLRDTCLLRGSHVETYLMDIREIDAFMDLVRSIDERLSIDLLIANAGVNTNHGRHGQGEPWEEASTLIEVNIRACMAMVHAVLPGMRRRRQGQIALISSLAGYFGLPVTPAYSASKAAVKAYGEGLRGWLASEGIQVNVVMPGYVTSPMCDSMPGPKPFEWPPEKAALVIRRGLAQNRARISFPFPLNAGTWLLAVMPAQWSIRILRWIGYRG